MRNGMSWLDRFQPAYGWRHVERICLVLLVLMGVTACVPPVAPEVTKSTRAVGVLSLLGDDVYAIKDVLLFGGVDELRPFPGAGFDAVAQQAVANRLRQSMPQATVVPVDVPTGPLREKAYGAVFSHDAGLDGIKPDIAAWAHRRPVDLVIVVYRYKAELPVGPMPPYAHGPGFYFKYLPLRHARIAPFACVGLAVWDGTRLKEVSARRDCAADDNRPNDRDEGKDPRHLRFSDEFEENFAGSRRAMLVDDLRAMVAGGTERLLIRAGL
jgi:hypothetical protein